MKLKSSLIRKEKIVQSRGWQLIIPAGWDNLEAIKERCRNIARNYYFIIHNYDKNELGEPVKPHWHLLMSFAAARRLVSMQNHFLEWGNFEDPKEEKESGAVKENEDYETPKDGQVVNEEGDQLLRSNSFERVYSIDGAKKYLVHAEDPNKYQYSPYDVETNDKLFINLFLPKTDEITATKNIIFSFKTLMSCNSFDEFLSYFEQALYTMSNAQRITHVIGLRKYYNEYKNAHGSLYYKDDGFDNVSKGVDREGYHETNYNYLSDSQKEAFKLGLDSVGELPF